MPCLIYTGIFCSSMGTSPPQGENQYSVKMKKNNFDDYDLLLSN